MTNSPNIFLIIGETGAGKSTYAGRLVKELSKRNVKVGGVLVYRLSENRKSLYSIALAKEMEFIDKKKTCWISFKKFFFNPKAIEWGTDILENDLKEKDVVIVDEVGLMELFEMLWYDVLNKWMLSNNCIMIWLVKKKLIDLVQQKFKFEAKAVYEITSGEKKQYKFLTEIIKCVQKKDVQLG